MEFICGLEYEEFTKVAEEKGKILFKLFEDDEKIVLDLTSSAPTNLYILCSKIIEEIKDESDDKNEMVSSLFSAFIMNVSELRNIYHIIKDFLIIDNKVDIRRFLLFLSYVDPSQKIVYTNKKIIIDAALSRFEIFKIISHDNEAHDLVPHKIKELI